VTSVLLVRLGALGDIVHAMPIVSALRTHWPDARIDWLVDPRYLDVVRLVDGVNEAIPFDPRQLVVAGGRAATVAAIADLRAAQYDLVLDLQGLIKSAAVAWLAGGAQTIGFAAAQLREPAARFLYTKTVDVPPDLHVIAKNMALLAAVGVDEPAASFSLRLPPSAVAEQIAAQHAETGFIAINPGAAWPNKRWPAPRFGRVAAGLAERHGLRTVVVWGPDEVDLARSVVAAADGAAELAPPTSITDLFAVFQRARVTIAGDTGPLHIAAAVGTPVVALFGPTDPARNGPWQDGDVTVSRFDACVCHYQRRCRRAVCCLDDISVDEVIEAVSARLAHAPGRGRA
jgi:heptosyltransferase-1